MVDAVSTLVAPNVESGVAPELVKAPVGAGQEAINNFHVEFNANANLAEPAAIDGNKLQISHGAQDDPLKKVFKAFVEMDSGYTKLADSIENRPAIDSYLSRHGISVNGIVGTSDDGMGKHLSNFKETSNNLPDKNFESHLDRMQNSVDQQRSYMTASQEFARDQSKWTHKVEMWSTKMKVLTAAVKQINTGLKTLFQSQ